VLSKEFLKCVRAYRKSKRARFKKALHKAMQDDSRFSTSRGTLQKRRGVRSGRNIGVSKLNS